MDRLTENFDYFTRELRLPSPETERLQKLFSELPQVNWADAIGPSQLVSKSRLVDKIIDHLTPETELVLIGGWIGLIPYLLDHRAAKFKSCLNIDLDPEALKASELLNLHVPEYSTKSIDASDFDYWSMREAFIINTSCEHLQNYTGWIQKIPSGTPCVLQSNNMFGLEEHVNCKSTLDEFVLECGLSSIDQTEAIDIGNNWSRFMIIGRK